MTDTAAMPIADEPIAACTLYRFFDAAGGLLYVGITNRGRRRVHEHSKTKDWWHRVDHATFEHFRTRLAALDAEARAITDEGPEHNIARPSPAADHPILGGRPDILEALGAQLKRNGYDLTAQELIAALKDGEIDPDELDGIAPNLIDMIMRHLRR